MSDFERAVEFVYGITRRAASTEVQSRFGAAYMNLEVPDVWSRNYLLATEGVTEASADDLAAETDRIMGGAGLRHRKVELSDDAAGERLEPGFRALGWVSEHDVIMVARRDPDRPVDTSIVDEVSLDDLEPAWTDGWKTDPAVLGAEVMRQLVEEQARAERGRGHAVLRSPRGRGGRELLRALFRRADRADRERPHAQQVPRSKAWPAQPSPRLSRRHGKAATT